MLWHLWKYADLFQWVSLAPGNLCERTLLEVGTYTRQMTKKAFNR